MAIRSALESARLDEAEALLRSADAKTSPDTLLAAAELRLLRDDAPAAIRLLSNKRLSPPRTEAQRLLLLGAASSRVGEYDAADEYLETADGLAVRLHDDELRAQIAYRRGRRYVMAHDAKAARAQLRIAATGTSLERKLDALHLESFILGIEDKYKQQARVLARLLRRVDPADERHAFTAAYATHTLAALARELDLPEATAVIERQLRGCTWSPELNVQRFQSLKALGWACALRGDYFNAFRYLKQSTAYAPSRAWSAIAMTDRAYLARCLREERWSRQELGEAEEIAEGVDWHATRNEERVGLLLLAEMFAPIDAGKAAHYMALYRDLGDLHAPLMHYTRDDRLQALADYSSGVTQLSLGNAKAGVKLVRRSFAVYDRIGYDWRAGRCALRLFEATEDAEQLRIAEEKLRAYPNCWLSEELRKLSPQWRLPKLPRMQQRVFEELCQGYSTRDIAKHIGRAEYTIKNHIKLVFKAYGVNSRAELLARYHASVRT